MKREKQEKWGVMSRREVREVRENVRWVSMGNEEK